MVARRTMIAPMLVAAIGLVAWSHAAEPRSAVQPGDFVGSETCAPCHRDEYDLWRSSTHGNAGGPPGPETMISSFDRTELTFKDAVVRFEVDAEGRYIVRAKQNYWDEKRYVIAAVIGGGHMQGGGAQVYFLEWPDGTLRYLPFEFHAQEQIWFPLSGGISRYILQKSQGSEGHRVQRSKVNSLWRNKHLAT